MATINQGKVGLQTNWDEPAPKAKPKEEPKPVLQRCEACRCEVVLQASSRRSRSTVTFVDNKCQFCAMFFGYETPEGGYMGGVTNASPAEALRKLKGLREQGFIMLLKDRNLAARNGAILNLQAGDIFPVSLSNEEPDEDGRPSKDHTWELFMITVPVGPFNVQLFPHEWSPISFKTVMECKAAGEIREAFVSADDKTGHFAPTPKIRRQIVAAFGRLIV